MLQDSAVVLMTDHFCIACNYPQLTMQLADRNAIFWYAQVVACLCHRSWPHARHSLQRCLPDGGTLCQQEHYQPGSRVCGKRSPGFGLGAHSVSGPQTYASQLHHPV